MNSNLTIEESKLILQKMEKLPIRFRNEVINFIDYMCLEYESHSTDKDENLELSDYGKVFLEERMQKMQSNSESNSSWKDVKARLYKKYNWEK